MNNSLDIATDVAPGPFLQPEVRDDSMEELKVDEGGGIYGGTEDILGSHQLQTASDAEGEQSPCKTMPKRIAKRIIDSDSEEEIDKDSSKEFREKNDKPDRSLSTSSILSSPRFMQLNVDDADKEVNTADLDTNSTAADDDLNEVHAQKRKKISKLIDSESEASDSGGEQEAEIAATGVEPHRHSETITSKQPMRASAKKAIDEMQHIQSEQQRLHREAHITVPYHVPKKYTLQEFLKRRTIIKPGQMAGEGSPAAAVVQCKGLKMTPEELEEYAKLMEERAKEAIEFFKSESEDEEGIEEGTVDEMGEAVIESETETIESQAIVEKDVGMAAPEQSVEIQHTAAESEQPSTSRAVILEVLELPKVDFFNINTMPQSEKNKSARIKRLIGEHKLPDVPSLHGSPNMLIDLDTGDLMSKTPTGVQNLMQRLLASQTRKNRTPETCNIMSTENGKIEISKVNVHHTEKDTECLVETKPGAAYLKLKENLKTIIKSKRLEDMRKKKQNQAEREEYEPHTKPGETEDVEENVQENDALQFDDEEEYIADNNEMLNEEDADDDDAIEQDGASECDEEDAKRQEDPDFTVDYGEIEQSDGDIANETADEFEEEVVDKEDDTELDSENEDTARKHRIIRAFQDDSDNEIDLLKTQQTQPLCAVATIAAPAALYEQEEKHNRSHEENELLALCSGKFTSTQQAGVAAAAIISQMPITQPESVANQTDTLLELCSGTFDGIEAQTQNVATEALVKTQTDTLYKKMISSDEENVAPVVSAEPAQARVKKLTKRMRKKTAQLCYSDDEGEADMSQESDADESEENIADEPETYIDYDSEENEVVVHMNQMDRIKAANKFVENEAVLSDSEWGSADEDERNMDRYDIELGDEDDFDRSKLQLELGRIHARKVLDEDIREVRKLQEMFFEDEETGGIGRQRQFRWKNAEAGFSLDDSRHGDKNNGDQFESGDEENEHLWRKVRFEREQILREQSCTTSTPTNVTLSNPSATNATIREESTSRKINIIAMRKHMTTTTMDLNKDGPFLISKGSTPILASATNVMAPMQKKVRGSFLAASGDTLKKLVGLTKTSGGTVGMGGSEPSGTVSVKAVKAKNFVFATLTEEEHELQNLKRKADDSMNSSNDNGTDYYKKRPRVEPRSIKCAIDQLL